MIDDARADTALMAVVRERLPELHNQIADEVARGKELRGTDIERAEREGRDRRLGDKKLGRIAETDTRCSRTQPGSTDQMGVRAAS